ncbi:uncharacterized protein V1510DRAFT_442667 [Dipodascopsis tothii]|uniref:uncharacterized protein n=1 Tax=Dipodascopsis tothii TaxID=44089 RepID=UPI0034CF82FB
MAAAMLMSLQELDPDELAARTQGQQSGVSFGPATQASYDAASWSLVPTTPTVQAVARERGNEPAVLVATDRAGLLAPLLVILHSVPLARAALLLGGEPLVDDYGIADEWWARELVFVPALAGFQQGTSRRSPLTPADVMRTQFLIELQRTMAFLDGGSRRACAGCDGVAHYFAAVAEDRTNPLDAFLGAWVDAASALRGASTAPARVFESRASVETYHDTSFVQKFYNLDLAVTAEAIERYGTFNGVLQSTLWEEESTLIRSLADVIVVSLHQESGAPGAGVDIPLEWYPDRYTAPFAGAMQGQIHNYVSVAWRLGDLADSRQQVLEHEGFNTKSLLYSTMTHFAGRPAVADRLNALSTELDDYLKGTSLWAPLTQTLMTARLACAASCARSQITWSRRRPSLTSPCRRFTGTRWRESSLGHTASTSRCPTPTQPRPASGTARCPTARCRLRSPGRRPRRHWKTLRPRVRTA